MIEVKVINKSSNTLPEYKTKGAAGFDIRANENRVITPNETAMVSTGLFVEIPEGYEIQIRSRSGIALKNVIVSNSPGTIDSDYRGEIKIIMTNLGSGWFKIEVGDRIAQGILNKVEQINFIPVEKLSETERGEGGFNSTGKK